MAHEYEKDIICPYCDHTFCDSWEYIDGGDDEIECINCDEVFHLEIIQSVDYTTKRIDCDEREIKQEHDLDMDTIHNHIVTEPNKWDDRKEPYRIWSIQCKKCDGMEIRKTDVDGDNPFSNEATNER